MTGNPERASPPPAAWRSRRGVLRALGWLILAPLPLAVASMLRRDEAVSRAPRKVVIPAESADTVTFVDQVIVCREGSEVRVFSARCTHLGCRISSAVNGQLVCPCHGSRFRLDGSVAAGPAARPLAALPYTADAGTGALIVHVS
jgi:Rieske Fe-S protein